MALTFDQITALTNKYYMPKFPQTVFDQNLLQKRLAAKGTKPSSGESIKQPIMHAMTKGGAYRPYDQFDTSAEQQVTAADFNWKYYEVPIVISRDELLKNQGPEGVKKLMDAKMKLARMKMSDLLATDMVAHSVLASRDTAAEVQCLELIYDDSSYTLTTADYALGGITKADLSTWAGTLTDVGGTGVGLNYIDMNVHYMEIADGNIQPDLIALNNVPFGRYVGSQQQYQRYYKQSEMDAGFLTATFNGQATLMADLHILDYGTTTETDNRCYFINTDFIDFVTHRDENNRLEPFAKPVDQAVGVAHIMWAGELTTSDPSRGGIMHNFDSLTAT